MTTIAVGTEKGAYLLTRSGDSWNVTGPLFTGWKVTAFGTTASGATLAALASNWFGASVHRSEDLRDWQQVDSGPSYTAESGRKLNQIWTFHSNDDRLYAGVDEAGLFESLDDGRSWSPVEGLNDHPSREVWVPGLGGLCAHHLLSDGNRLWVAISAVGVFRSDDGGSSFSRYDDGVPATVDENMGSKEPGFCVHSIVGDPGEPDRMWRQDHQGVFRTGDGGQTWERIEGGLPASFGFPIVRDHASGRLFVVPLHSDENRLPVDGAFRVYASDDDGDTWQVSGTGWPDGPTYTAVLRRAMAADQLGGLFAGTTSGTVWVTSDVGLHWTALPITLPRILSVDVVA
jgi:photosystem II stability/assembly factor-like uncharacterized protein